MNNTPFHEFIVGQRIERDDVPNHYKIIDLDSHKVSRPTVVVLGGKGTDYDQFANGYAKLVQSLLGGFADDADILSVNYHGGFNTETYVKENAKMLAKKLLLPLVSKDNKKIDVDEACRNLRQLTFFAHCYGDKLMDHLVSAFQEELTTLDYNTFESNKILEQIFMVSYGILTSNPKIQGLNIISPFDETYPYGKHIWKMLLAELDSTQMSPNDRKVLNEIKDVGIGSSNPVEKKAKALKEFYKFNNRCYVLKFDKIIHLASTMHYDEYSSEHSVVPLARDEDWNARPQVSPTGDCISKCIACALCNSVANSMLNKNSSVHIPFDINFLKSQLEEITKALNEKEIPFQPEL